MATFKENSNERHFTLACDISCIKSCYDLNHMCIRFDYTSIKYFELVFSFLAFINQTQFIPSYGLFLNLTQHNTVYKPNNIVLLTKPHSVVA